MLFTVGGDGTQRGENAIYRDASRRFLHERFIHVPIELLAAQVQRLDPASGSWRSVLTSTGQPELFD